MKFPSLSSNIAVAFDKSNASAEVISLSAFSSTIFIPASLIVVSPSPGVVVVTSSLGSTTN